MIAQLELLEYLACAIKCEYLSDLRCRAPAAAVGEALRAIPPQAFPAEQWREAASYLTGEDCDGLDSGACRRRLLEHYPVWGGEKYFPPLTPGAGGDIVSV